MSPGRRFVLLVGAALLAGCGLRIAIGLTDDAPATDETAYLQSGSSLVAGDGFTRGDRPELHFPPFVPFVLGSVSRLVDDPHTATVAMTVVCGTLLLVPLALLARRVAGPDAGIATAWIAALAPGLATTPAARGAGSEAEYALLVVTAVLLVAGAADRTGLRRALLAGAAGLLTGLAYLTRPEGLFVAVPLGAALVLTSTGLPRLGDAGQVDVGAIRRPFPAGDADLGGDAASRAADTATVLRLRAAAGVALAFGLPLLLCVAPYARFLHEHTGTWELTAKTRDASIEAWHAVARDDRRARDAVLYELDDSGFRFAPRSSPLPALARHDPAGYLGIVATNVGSLARNVGGWWLLPLPVWIVAGLGAWRRRRSGTLRLALAVGALPVATALAFFVQPRYLVVTVALATVPAGAAVSTWTTRYRRPLIATGAALLAAASALAFYGAGGWWHPNDHTDQRRAGEWISAHTDGGDRVMTRSLIVGYYADRPTLAIPYADLDRILAFGRHHGARYLVVDAYTVDKLRPQLVALASDDRPAGLELVHEVTAEGRTTRVFALVPPPAGPATDEPAPSLGFMGDGLG